MLSAPVVLPRPRRIQAGTLTCGNSRRHPGEPRALTFHYIFHYISHPFSWWQLVPWLLRRGDALHSVHPILSDTHTPTRTCVPTATHTNSHWIHCFLRWLTPDYCFLFTSGKVTSQAGGQQEVMTAMTPRFDPLLDPCIDDDEMMFQHYKKHHFSDSKEPKTVFTLSFNTTNKDGVCFFTKRLLLLHPI